MSDTAAGPNVPATAVSRFYNANQGTVVAVGPNFYWQTGDPNAASFWFVVVDMANNLKLVASALSTTNNSVPANISSLLGNPNYFMFVAGNTQRGYNVPHGDLYTFLQKAGSGAALGRLEQMVSQLGTGSIIFFSYVLGATLSDTDGVGFEAMSIDHVSVLTMQFMPVTVNGQTIYAPIQLGAQV